MRRLTVLLAVVVALVLSAGAALAETRGDTGEVKARIEAEPLKKEAASVPTEGLTAPLPAEDGKITVEESSVQGASESGAAATQAKWLSGTSSNTHYWNPINNQIQMLTTEFVSYWGTEDQSYPRVGELYWGKVTIGNVNPSMPTPVMAEVELPRNTKFALVDNDPNMKIRCILDNFQTGGSQELTGDLCPQAAGPVRALPARSEGRVLDDQAGRGDKRHLPHLLHVRAQGLGRDPRRLPVEFDLGCRLDRDLGCP